MKKLEEMEPIETDSITRALTPRILVNKLNIR